MSKFSTSRIALTIALLGGIGVGALALYVKKYPEAERVPDDVRRPAIAQPRESTLDATGPKESKKTRTAVFLPVLVGEDVSLAVDQSSAPEGIDPLAYVGSELVSLMKLDGVKLMSVEVRDHVAILNFNQKLNSGMGSMQEANFAKAIQTTYGQFKDLDSVLVQVEGQPAESGHFDFSDPLPVSRKGQATASSAKPIEP